MELKLIIICADCKKQIGTIHKSCKEETIETLLKLAYSYSDKIAWHNLNHGKQVYAAIISDDQTCNLPKSLYTQH
jgi:hypothetical protein